MKTARLCVRVRPIIRRTTRFVTRHVVKTSVVGFVPSVVNDAVIHHAQVTPLEMARVATDEVTVTSMTALAMALMKLL